MSVAEHSELLVCSQYKAHVIRTLTRRQRGKCYLCGKQLGDPRRLRHRDPNFPTLDHYIPQSRGGTDDIDNLAMAHRSCNLSKADTLPADLVWRGGRADAARDGLRGGLEVQS